jgi:hypothetical protein
MGAPKPPMSWQYQNAPEALSTGVVQASSVCQPTMMTTARPRIQSR